MPMQISVLYSRSRTVRPTFEQLLGQSDEFLQTKSGALSQLERAPPSERISRLTLIVSESKDIRSVKKISNIYRIQSNVPLLGPLSVVRG